MSELKKCRKYVGGDWLAPSSALVTLGFGVLAATGAAIGQGEPYPLGDLYPGVGHYESSYPGFLATVGDLALIEAQNTAPHGSLWASDGTAAGTVPLFPDCFSLCQPGPPPDLPPQVGAGFAILALGDGLWRTDGTPEGTQRLFDTPWRSTWALGTLQGGQRVLQGVRAANGTALWTSDGTAAGSVLLPDVHPPDRSVAVELGGMALFAATDGKGTELWRTDGTPAGTGRVADIARGKRSSTPMGLVTLGGSVVFTADDGVHGRELWVSNGTPSGTRLLVDLTRGRRSTAFASVLFAAAEGRFAYFVAGVSGQPPELWRTDGTAKGTMRLTQFRNTRAFLGPRPIKLVDRDRVWFAADDGIHGFELWTSLGTPESTALPRDICPGPCHGSAPEWMRRAGGRYFFAASAPGSGMELWQTDGTPAGTTLVKDVCPGSCDSNPLAVGARGRFALVIAQEGPDRPYRLWRSDGTPAGTVVLTRWPFRGVFYGSTAETRRGVLFGAAGVVGGTEPWISDGTVAGTRPLADLAQGFAANDSAPTPFAPDGAGAQFLARVRTGVAWFTSDGTAAGTRRLGLLPVPAEISRDRLPIYPAPDGSAFVALQDPLESRWHLIARPPGTAAPRELGSFGSWDSRRVALLGSRLLFVADEKPWSSDAATGTVELLNPLSSQVSPFTRFAVAADRACYVDWSGDHLLWATDGTAAGTAPVEPVTGELTTVQCVTAVGDRVVFSGPADSAPSGSGLWGSDGTAEGTFPLGDEAVAAPTCGSEDELWATASQAFVFDHGCLGAWATDGTSAGTVQVFSEGHPDCPDSIEPFAATATHVFAWTEDLAGLIRLVALDGTVGGIEPLLELDGPVGFGQKVPIVGDRLVIGGRPLGGGELALRSMDGSAHGAERLLGLEGVELRAMRSYGHLALMLVRDSAGAESIWRTDGTAAGTWSLPAAPVEALSSALLGSDPNAVTIVGDRLYYMGYGEAGFEPWVLPIGP